MALSLVNLTLAALIQNHPTVKECKTSNEI